MNILNPAWICAHHLGLSVILTIFSCIGFVLALVLAGTIMKFTWEKTDDITDKIKYKIPYKTREKMGDRFKLLALGFMIVFAVVLFVTGGLDFAKVALFLIVAIAIGFGLLKLLEKAFGRIPQLGTVALCLLSIILFGMVSWAIHDLYLWWVLKICGS